MFVILSYDIGAQRVSKVMRTVKKYLYHRQRSVFEGNITESRLKELMRTLARITEPEEDSIIIYKVGSNRLVQAEELGPITPQSDGII